MVHVKGETHSSLIAAFLMESWAAETFTDVTLYCGDPGPSGSFGKLRAINANSSVLAAGSPVFRHYLRQVVTENEDNIIVMIPDYSYKVIRELVLYLYTGTLPGKITPEFQQASHHFRVSIAQPLSTELENTGMTADRHVRIRVLPPALTVSSKGKPANQKQSNFPRQFKVRSRIVRELPQSHAQVLQKQQRDRDIDAPRMSEEHVTLSISSDLDSKSCSPEKGLHADQYFPRTACGSSNRVTGKSLYLGTLTDIGIYNNFCKNINKGSVSQNSTTRQILINMDESDTLHAGAIPMKRYSKGSLDTRKVIRLPSLSDTSVEVSSLSRHGNKIHVTLKGPPLSSGNSSALPEGVSKGEENHSPSSDFHGSRSETAENSLLETFAEEKKRHEKLKNKLRSLRNGVIQAKILARKLLAKNGASLDPVARKVATLTDIIRKTPAPKLPCRICKKLVSKSYMWSHLQIHSETAYLCEQCGRIFTLKSGLQMHQKYQHGEEFSLSIACSICGKKFTKSHNLKMHMSLHDGLKPHSCHVCGKKFRLAHSLKKHTRVHTGERPYECQVCSKTFRTRSSYKNHTSKHSLCPRESRTEWNASAAELPEVPLVQNAQRAIKFPSEEAAASILLILPTTNCS